MIFPFLKGGASSVKNANGFVKKITGQSLKIEGFIEKSSTVFLFYNYSDIEDGIIKRVFYKTKANTLWWCLIDEICNHKKVLNFPVHPSVYTTFSVFGPPLSSGRGNAESRRLSDYGWETSRTIDGL